jgi:hypothetical protein
MTPTPCARTWRTVRACPRLWQGVDEGRHLCRRPKGHGAKRRAGGYVPQDREDRRECECHCRVLRGGATCGRETA